MIDAAHYKISAKDQAPKKKWNSHDASRMDLDSWQSGAVAPGTVRRPPPDTTHGPAPAKLSL
jgi:hypothetical protein